jgi:polysaccharide export outer membrane protein
MMISRKIRTIALLCLTCMASVAASVATVAAQSRTPATAATAAADAQEAQTPADYRLEIGDNIDIRFFYNQELNESVQIRPDGLVSMPLIGDIRAAGQTPASLAQELSTRYRDVVKQPAITVQVRGFANRRVFIGGEVTRPGVLPLVGVTTALGAITEAGGLTQRAKRGEILLIRRGAGGQPEMRRLSLKSKKKGQVPEAAVLQLRPLDVVVVMESAIAKTNRAVDQYVRQLTPGLLTFGFTYLFNADVVGATR